MATDFLRFSEIVQTLAKLVKDRASGALFIVTDTNKSGQIMLDHGEIRYLYYANARGREALRSMPSIGAGRFRFQEGPFNAKPMDLPATSTILDALRTRDGDTSDEPPLEATSPPGGRIELSARERSILEECLAEFVGPIAGVVCEEHLATAPSLQAAIDALETEIASEIQALEFRAMVMRSLATAA